MSSVETTPDTFAECGCGSGGALPDDPFTALRFHFGMLLGVDDFEVEQGFHHGKQRLHNAWLHRDGVVWGLGVQANQDDDGEIRVLPGLALDGAGRELHLDNAACVSVTAWYQQHEADVDATAGEGGAVTFDAYVVANYATCPMRPVPALAEPCAGMTTNTAYSRTYETVDLTLVSGEPPQPVAPPYHRLRVLLGLDAPGGEDDDVVATRASALAAADPAAALLAAFDSLAALDAIDLQPAAELDEPATRYPALETEGVLLARIPGITLAPGGTDGTGWTLTGAGAVDYTGRRTLVATETLQELLCGASRIAGPTFDPAQTVIDSGSGKITLVATAALEPATVTKQAFTVSSFDGGWTQQNVTAASLDAGTTVTVTAGTVPAGQTIRIVASGTGPTPILAADDLTPLGGGVDFVQMKGS
ncbi:MAG TPA: hypothetical protein VFB25_08065 [Gaiellaceae bacterium]|nr:hypothetical protein [Gaiellaceae bacterium]